MNLVPSVIAAQRTFVLYLGFWPMCKGDVMLGLCKREGLILSPMQGQAIYHSVSDSWKSWRKSLNFSSILHLFLGSLFSAPYSVLQE